MLKKWIKATGKALSVITVFFIVGFFMIYALLPSIDFLQNRFNITSNIITIMLTILTLILVFIFLLRPFAKEPSQIRTSTSSEIIKQTVDRLGDFSDEIDVLMQDITSELQKRESALTALESKNKELVIKEEELKKKIKLLQNVPIEVVEYFRELNQQSLQQMQKRAFRRDIIIFVLGVMATSLVGFLLNLIVLTPG